MKWYGGKSVRNAGGLTDGQLLHHGEHGWVAPVGLLAEAEVGTALIGYIRSLACCSKKDAPVGTSENAISIGVHRTRLVRTPRTSSPSCLLGTWLVSSG